MQADFHMCTYLGLQVMTWDTPDPRRGTLAICSPASPTPTTHECHCPPLLFTCDGHGSVSGFFQWDSIPEALGAQAMELGSW